MLTYKIIVGERQTGFNQIPILFVPHIESKEESLAFDNLRSSSTSFGALRVHHGYYNISNTMHNLLYSALTVGATMPKIISCSSNVDACSSNIAIVDSRYCDLIHKYVKILRSATRTSLVLNGGPRPFNTRTKGDDTIEIDRLSIYSPITSNIDHIFSDGGFTLTQNYRSSNGEAIPTPCAILTVPKYEEGLIEELVSLVAICLGEPIRARFAEEIETVIEKMGKLYFSKGGSRYVRKISAPGDLEKAIYSQEYKDLLDYREKYIRCRH